MKTETRNILIAFLLGAGSLLFMGQRSMMSGRYHGVETANGYIIVVDSETGTAKLVDRPDMLGVPFERIISNAEVENNSRSRR